MRAPRLAVLALCLLLGLAAWLPAWGQRAVLVDRMGLPRRSPDNQLMSYRLHHRATGRQLLDSETLTAAQVQNGDILRLQAEITAGRV